MINRQNYNVYNESAIQLSSLTFCEPKWHINMYSIKKTKQKQHLLASLTSKSKVAFLMHCLADVLFTTC